MDPRDADATLMRLRSRQLSSPFNLNLNLADGTAVTIRAVCPEDEPLVIRFHKGLSSRTVYLRYFCYFQFDRRIERERLRRHCIFDCNSEMAFVAEMRIGDKAEIVGIGRLSRSEVEPEAEVSVTVTDSYQGRGVGSALVSRLVNFARELGLHRLTASVLLENISMRRIFERAGFKFDRNIAGEVLEAELILSPHRNDHFSGTKAA